MSGGAAFKKTAVWLIAGTTEGRQIAGALCERGLDVLATVTTPAGQRLLAASCPKARIEVGLFDEAAMSELISRENIGLVVDATHPYAQMASRNAVAATVQSGVPYIRYERPAASQVDYPLLARAADFEAAAHMATAFGSTVFLTVGSRQLMPFVREARKAQVKIIARILDDPISIKIAAEAGLAESEIRFFDGAFDEERESEYLRGTGVSVVVCKDSGAEGGTVRKIEACRSAGVPIILIDRPVVAYPLVYSDPLEVAERIFTWAEGGQDWAS